MFTPTDRNTQTVGTRTHTHTQPGLDEHTGLNNLLIKLFSLCDRRPSVMWCVYVCARACVSVPVSESVCVWFQHVSADALT